VVGFDDSPVAHLTDPKLSTVRQPVDVMTARMVRELMTLIITPGQRPAHVVLPTQLVLRDSS
jgi:DNA-binding LacI/PurR family transcriptional regulator